MPTQSVVSVAAIVGGVGPVGSGFPRTDVGPREAFGEQNPDPDQAAGVPAAEAAGTAKFEQLCA